MTRSSLSTRLRRAALATLGAAALLAHVPAALAQAPIKIGTFLAVTGPAAFLGDPEQKTLEMYVEKLNAAGGLLGRKLQLVSYDSAGDAEKARTFARRLVEQDKVDLIIGGSTTGETMAVVPIVEQAQVPFISLAGAVVVVEPVKKWVFKTPHTDRMACERIFLDLRSRKLQNIALISGAGGFDRSMRAECLKVASTYAINVVADESYGAGDTDMTAQLTKIKNNAQVQAVLNAGFGQGPAIVTRNFRQVGLTVPLYQSHGVSSKEYIKLSGGAAEGVRLPAAAMLVAEKLPADDVQRNVALSYKKAYEARFKQEISTFGGHAHDALFIAVEAMKRAGSADKPKVRDEIEKTKNFVGTGGVVTMTPKDHMGLNLTHFRMLEVKNGDWSLVQ